jgi:N-alpha-acetyltransferase 15/16, NatA auxiliary subunit
LQTVSLFVKHEGDVVRTLSDLQCQWYALEAGDCFSRLRQWGPALKQFYNVKKHFVDQYDDLFDFHGYCIRKSTLRAYLDLLDTQDRSFGHAGFQRAFRGAATVLLHLLDCPEDIDGLGHLSPAERKKERAKLKKKKAKEEKEKEEKEKAAKDANAAQAAVSSAKDNTDPDPVGAQLLSKDLSAELTHWCSLLSAHLGQCSADTLSVYVEASLRRQKLAPAVRALTLGFQKDPQHPALHLALVKLMLKLKSGSASAKKLAQCTSAIALAGARERLQELLGGAGKRLIDYANDYLK